MCERDFGRPFEACDHVAGAWAQEQWLKFPTEQAVMFTGEQLKAGAKVLKDMTEEQLAQYDWSQMSADALAQLPPELQDKIGKLSKVCLCVFACVCE